MRGVELSHHHGDCSFETIEHASTDGPDLRGIAVLDTRGGWAGPVQARVAVANRLNRSRYHQQSGPPRLRYWGSSAPAQHRESHQHHGERLGGHTEGGLGCGVPSVFGESGQPDGARQCERDERGDRRHTAGPAQPRRSAGGDQHPQGAKDAGLQQERRPDGGDVLVAVDIQVGVDDAADGQRAAMPIRTASRPARLAAVELTAVVGGELVMLVGVEVMTVSALSGRGPVGLSCS